MALQLQTVLGEGLGLQHQLSSTIAFDTGTLEALTNEILKLGDAPSERTTTDSPRGSLGEAATSASRLLSRQHLNALSDEEVAVLLAQRIPAKQMGTDQ